MQRTILCYGDSNTWGYVPQQSNKQNGAIQRYSRKQSYFLDISKTVFPSRIDGLHLDDVAHKKLAHLIFEKIDSIFCG